MSAQLEVCIPIYNEEKTIGRLLEALKSQSFGNFCVRVFDNASTDNSLGIVNAFKGSLDISVIGRSCNIGQNSNINRAFANCTSEYVALLSGNDLIQENYFEVLLDKLTRDPDAASAYAKPVSVNDDLLPVDINRESSGFYSLEDDDPIKRACGSISNYCQASNFFALYRKQVLDRVQPQPYRYGGDHVFAAEVALYGKLLFTDQTTVFRRPPPVSGRSNTRIEHLLRLFSRDTERGLGEFSKLSNFELITPIIDMFHGFLDMFRLADIPQANRIKLTSMGLQALMARLGGEVQADIENLVNVFEFVEKGINSGQFIDRITVFQMLRKVNECILVASEPRLFDLQKRLSKLYTDLGVHDFGAYQRVATH